MEQSDKIAAPRSIAFAAIHAATYVVGTWLLTSYTFEQPVAVIIAVVPIITFALFVFHYIKAIAAMDEIKQRVQLEAVVVGFSLITMLLMLLFLLNLSGIETSHWFGHAYLVIYCWAFYFIGWLISKKKYGV